MSLYQGWNRQEMQHAGKTSNEPSDLQNNISSFTPVNHNAKSQFIIPSKTLISRALDSDTLYDLPDEEQIPDVAPPKGRKRALTQVSQGRAVSLGAVWKYNDEGDIQGGDIEDHVSSKRRKVALAKRSQSKKEYSTTQSEIWDVEGTLQGQTQADEQSNSQLTTPPDSSRKGKKGASSSRTHTKAKKTKPFKNPLITKPSTQREKEVEDHIPGSNPVSTYQGWTTTEDALKLNANGIGKTTLDKLAAFRYKPTADAAVPFTNLPAEATVGPKYTDEHDLQLERHGIDQNSTDHMHTYALDDLALHSNQTAAIFGGTQGQISELNHFQSDNGMILNTSHHDFFADALWNHRSSSKMASSNLQNPSNRQVDELPPHGRPSMLEPEFQQHFQQGISIDFSQYLLHSAPPLHDSTAIAEPSQPAPCSFEPTSSEARAFQSIAEPISVSQHDEQVSSRSKIRSLATLDRTWNSSDQLMGVNLQDYEMLRNLELATSSEKLPSLRTQIERPPLQTVSFDFPQSGITPPKPLTIVQIERSDLDDVEPVLRDVSKDYESEEFDEGLDDQDLLAMVTDVVGPETQFNVEPSVEGQATLPTKQRVILAAVLANDIPATESSVEIGQEAGNAKPISEDDRLLTLRYSCSQPEHEYLGLADEEYPDEGEAIGCVNSDDEFPMDEGDEEMFRMRELMTTGVIEKFQVPTSLQYACGDTGEVYNSSLQFSPPIHCYATVSHTKAQSGRHTDRLAADYPSTHHSDPELLQTGEEENWDLICSAQAVKDTEVQVITVNSESQGCNTRWTESRELLSSPASSAQSRPDSVTIPGSARTNTFSVDWMLDDSHEYKPLLPFARPDFPIVIRDRSPILGVSAQTFLRVCFRVGEVFKEGARCEVLKQDAVIELFARVVLSSREPGTTKQHFQFADLWHDRPPFPDGVLANYKTTGLAESESKVLVGADEGTIVRCLGRLKRDSKSGTGWMLHIITIRTTDWEEIRWTKRIVSADLIKSET